MNIDEKVLNFKQYVNQSISIFILNYLDVGQRFPTNKRHVTRDI